MSDENKAFDDNNEIQNCNYEDFEYEASEFQDLGKDLFKLNRALKPHGHSVCSLLREFALKMHGIRF